MADDQRLPFRLFDSALNRMKRAVHAGSDVARGAIGRGSDVRTTDAQVSGVQPSDVDASDAQAADAQSARTADGEPRGGPDGGGARTQAASILDGDGPAGTATAAPALATALDEQARAALAAHADTAGAVTDGLAVTADAGRVAPEQERGPKPFTPQVGP